MKYFVILLTLLASSVIVVAQTAEDSVKTAINKMFAAMKNANASSLRSVFADSAIFQTITRNKEGVLLVANESPAEFIDFVGKQKPGACDERITFETVKTDGPLAIAWTPYNFYFNGQFSHCGVNSFQLVRFNGEWKVQYIIDTRRRQGCTQ
jgi:hypothetical protein